MREIWNWLVKNFSNVFSLLGIVLTFYFSIFYVPDYIKENENERIRNINQDLMEDLQGIIYNEYSINQNEIESLIKGKEIKFKVIYPYTTDELLIQTQELFMSNRFIPLVERIVMVKRIDTLRSTLKPTVPVVQESAYSFNFYNSNIEDILTLLTILIGIITTIIGTISLVNKVKTEKSYEYQKGLKTAKNSITSEVYKGLNFNNIILNFLTDKGFSVKYIEDDGIFGRHFLVNISSDLKIAVRLDVYFSDYSEIFVKMINVKKNRSENKTPVIFLSRFLNDTSNINRHSLLNDRNFHHDDIYIVSSNNINELKEQLISCIDQIKSKTHKH